MSLKGFVRNLSEGIYISDAREQIVDANPAFLGMLGVQTLEDLASFSLSEMVVDPARRMLELDQLDQLDQLDRDGAVRAFELQIIRPDGVLRTVLDTTFACRDSGTNEVFDHGILSDTARARSR